MAESQTNMASRTEKTQLGENENLEVVIRRVKRGELERVVQLFSDAFQRENEITGFDVRRIRRMTKVYSFAINFLSLLDLLHIDFETILVAIIRKTVAGGVHLVPHGKKVWSIDSVAVDAQFRRRGIYKNLMKEALRYVAERRGERIIQTIRTDNAAPLKVANELGFRVFDERNVFNFVIDKIPRVTTEDALSGTIAKTDVERVYETCSTPESEKIEKCEVEPQGFTESFVNRMRNAIAQIHSKKWVLVRRDKIEAYASVVYMSPKEAGKIDSFCILPSKDAEGLAELLICHLLNFLHEENIPSVSVSLSKELAEVSTVFRNLGFTYVASFYEAIKEFNQTNLPQPSPKG